MSREQWVATNNGRGIEQSAMAGVLELIRSRNSLARIPTLECRGPGSAQVVKGSTSQSLNQVLGRESEDTRDNTKVVTAIVTKGPAPGRLGRADREHNEPTYGPSYNALSRHATSSGSSCSRTKGSSFGIPSPPVGAHGWGRLNRSWKS
jgi:hypothetical protein